MNEMAPRQARSRTARLPQAKLENALDYVQVNGNMEHHLPGNLNMSFVYVEGESLLMGINDIAVSSGSACTSATLEPSYVLKALGLGDDVAHSSIRFGLGRFNTKAEVDYVADKLIDVVQHLRELSPLYEMVKEGIDLTKIEWAAHYDVMRLQIRVNPETQVIEDAKFKTFGCGSAIASSSLATEWVKGKTVAEALTISNTDIVKELALPPVKIHCSCSPKMRSAPPSATGRRRTTSPNRRRARLRRSQVVPLSARHDARLRRNTDAAGLQLHQPELLALLRLRFLVLVLAIAALVVAIACR
jgi:NifU-like protein involved in Fe-S cluster formation